jgi:hypothetical protein
MMRGVVLTGLLAGVAISAAAGADIGEDEKEWSAVGAALAQGWFDPLPLTACTARTVRVWTEGKTAGYKAAGGFLRAEYDLEIEGGGRLDGAQAYLEVHRSGFGYVLGRYVNNPSNRVVTPPLLVTEKGFTASASVAGKKAGKPFRLKSARLTVTPIAAVARMPADGVRIDDNTPVFAWYTEDPMGCTVEISREKDFPPAKTFTRQSEPGLPFLVWETPLAEGRWYWRLRTAAGFTGETRAFVQTARPSADREPPDIFAAPRSLATPQTIYGFHLGGDDVAKVTAELEGRPLQAAFKGCRAGVRPPSGGWPRGVKRLTIIAVDTTGNAATSAVYIACNPGVPAVRWGGRGESATIGGEMFEPRGLYGVGTARDTPANTNEFAIAKRCGFNYVHSYGRDGPPPSPELLRRFDEMEAMGLKTMISFSRPDVRRQRFDRIAAKMDALIDHPALLAWYLSDEPDTQEPMPVPAVVFRRFNRFVKALDPAHPTLLSFCMPRSLKRYPGCCDVHLTQAYQDSADEVRKHLEKTAGDVEALPDDMKHTGIVNIRTAKDADDLAAKIAIARENGCGFMVYALFEALRAPGRLERLEEAMRKCLAP